MPPSRSIPARQPSNTSGPLPGIYEATGISLQRAEQRDQHQASMTTNHQGYNAPPGAQHPDHLPIDSSRTDYIRGSAASPDQSRFVNEGHSSSPSAASSSDTSPIAGYSDDGESSGMHTPALSQRPSGSTIIAEGRRKSRVTKKRAPGSASSCQPCKSGICPTENRSNDDHRANAEKMLKERSSRKGLSYRLQEMEDLTHILIGYQGATPQNPANANSAGLRYKKSENLDSCVALAAHYLTNAFFDALETDRVEEWQAEQTLIIEGKRGDPLKGSLIGGFNGLPCDHSEGQKACITHNEPSWRLCREERRRDAFAKNIAARVNDLPASMRAAIRQSASWKIIQSQISKQI